VTSTLGLSVNALLISVEDDEGGAAVIEIGGIEVTVMDCLGYGTSKQPYPKVGAVFEARFTCLFDDGTPTDWLTVFGGNPQQQQRLEPTGIWSYRAYGKLVSGSNPDDGLLADCGGPLIPLPIDVNGGENIGSFVAFNIMRLSVWRA